MRVVQFTRLSNGEPVYTQAEHITFIRGDEDKTGQTVLITLSERERISEDLATAVGIWVGPRRVRAKK